MPIIEFRLLGFTAGYFSRERVTPRRFTLTVRAWLITGRGFSRIVYEYIILEFTLRSYRAQYYITARFTARARRRREDAPAQAPPRIRSSRFLWQASKQSDESTGAAEVSRRFRAFEVMI